MTTTTTRQFRPVISADGYWITINVGDWSDPSTLRYTGPSWVRAEYRKALSWANDCNRANRYPEFESSIY